MTRRVVDLFAGPGGLDIAAQAHGFDVVGIELDDAACATREAAGLATVQASVDQLDPLDHAPCVGLMGGPPCPTFSMAGKGTGRDDLTLLRRAIYQFGNGGDWRATAAQCKDPRTPLVLEPLRWAIALEPEWIVLEQVPPVLPIWEMTAIALMGRGYNVWTGVLYAEQYGVPQTRRRAVLLAARGRFVTAPAPTHQRYDGGPAQDSLCGTLQPWVSMEEALGWGMTDRPVPTIAAGKTGDGRVFGSEQRSGQVLSGERARGAWRVKVPTGGPARNGDLSANTVTAQAKSTRVEVRQLGNTKGGSRPNGLMRNGSEPAPTLTSRADQMERRHLDLSVGDGYDQARPRSEAEPAGTITGKARSARWEGAGDPVRLTIEEAAVLQTFPADYPWQGSRTKRYQQIGNAVPPLLGYHVIAAAAGLDAPESVPVGEPAQRGLR